MACNLLPTSLSHRFCHKDETKAAILIKTSVHGSSKCAGCAFDKASFAARSASSFPLISRWLGIQQNVMNLPLDIISLHICKTLFTRGFLLSWLPMTCNTDILSENITKRSTEETFTSFEALSIVSTSAVINCNHLLVYNSLFHQDKHMQKLLFLSILDPSVYMWQKSEYFCLNSLNRLLEIVEAVDDLSNSDKVKSTVTGSEFHIGTSGILLIAISPTSIFSSFNNFVQCIPKESVADSLFLCSSWCLGLNTTS